MFDNIETSEVLENMVAIDGEGIYDNDVTFSVKESHISCSSRKIQDNEIPHIRSTFEDQEMIDTQTKNSNQTKPKVKTNNTLMVSAEGHF